MYFAIKMPSWCNAVGVVLLIAQGWRGTSLPWVSIRKGIQRCKCELFLRKHGYNEDIHGGLRLESVTPMALKHVFHGVINVNIHMDKWWIASKKYNTYSVVPRKPYVTPG